MIPWQPGQGSQNPNRTWIAVKSADETVNNSNTLQNDDHLALAVESDRSYLFELVAQVSQVSAVNIECDFTIPAGASGWYCNNNGPAADVGWQADSALTNNAVIDIVSGRKAVILKGYLLMGTTAGTLQWRWAQEVTLGGSSLTVYRGSWLQLWEIG